MSEFIYEMKKDMGPVKRSRHGSWLEDASGYSVVTGANNDAVKGKKSKTAMITENVPEKVITVKTQKVVEEVTVTKNRKGQKVKTKTVVETVPVQEIHIPAHAETREANAGDLLKKVTKDKSHVKTRAQKAKELLNE